MHEPCKFFEGKPYQPKPEPKPEKGSANDLDDIETEWDEVLAEATEEDLVDLAGKNENDHTGGGGSIWLVRTRMITQGGGGSIWLLRTRMITQGGGGVNLAGKNENDHTGGGVDLAVKNENDHVNDQVGGRSSW